MSYNKCIIHVESITNTCSSTGCEKQKGGGGGGGGGMKCQGPNIPDMGRENENCYYYYMSNQCNHLYSICKTYFCVFSLLVWDCEVLKIIVNIHSTGPMQVD